MARLSALLPVIAVCGGLALSVVSAPAAAQETGGEAAPRYVFVPVEKGALRLNTGTGEVSLCTGADGAGTCAPLPDDERGGRDDVAALQDRVSALESRLAALEDKSPSLQSRREEEEALDRVMVLTERMMRRFFGMVRDMKEDYESGRL